MSIIVHNLLRKRNRNPKAKIIKKGNTPMQILTLLYKMSALMMAVGFVVITGYVIKSPLF